MQECVSAVNPGARPSRMESDCRVAAVSCSRLAANSLADGRGGRRSIHDVDIRVSGKPKTAKALSDGHAGWNALARKSDLFISKIGRAQNRNIFERYRNFRLGERLLNRVICQSSATLAYE